MSSGPTCAYPLSIMARSPFTLPPEWAHLSLLLALAVLAGCSQTPQRPLNSSSTYSHPPSPTARNWITLSQQADAQEVVLYALGLLDTGYRFGGKNPSAGLDCSGMVSYIVEQVSGRKLPYNAAGIAERTRPHFIRGNPAWRPGVLQYIGTRVFPHGHLSWRGEVHPCPEQQG